MAITVPSSSPWPRCAIRRCSSVAVAVIGIGASGLAFITFTTLTGRVGPTRGAALNYFVPVVAIVLGVVLRDESLAGLSVLGVALVMLGASLVSGRESRGAEPAAVSAPRPRGGP